METTRPPPPTAISAKPKASKKKTTKKPPQKKPKSQQPQPKPLSPITKKETTENSKQKLYDLYENFQNYDHKRADAEIKMAEQKQLEVLRDMLVKGFAVKNLQSLHRTMQQPNDKKVAGKINERGDGFKFGLSEKNVVPVKAKANIKPGGGTVKKGKTLKKSPVKKSTT